MSGYFHKSCAAARVPRPLARLAPIGLAFHDLGFLKNYMKLVLVFALLAWLALMGIGIFAWLVLKDKSGILEFLLLFGIGAPLIVGPILFALAQRVEKA
jgi:hypothetical protein